MRTVWIKHSLGFTMVELLVSLALGLLVSAGVIQVYLAGKQSYRIDEALSRLQENGRFAVNLMARDLRLAGFIGCSSRKGVSVTNNSSTYPVIYPVDFQMPIEGFEGGDSNSIVNWSLNGGTDENGNALTLVPNSDVIRIIYGNSAVVDVAIGMANSNANITTRSAHDGLEKNDIAIVTDCIEGDIFDIQERGVGGTVFNPSSALSRAYAINSQLTELQARHYFIASSNGTALLPSLYRRDYETDQPQAIIEGIEDIQITYGLDNDGDDYADTYVTANNVTNWQDVASVNLSLLLVSIDDNITAESVSANFNGATVNAGTDADRRLRHIYSTTITLRNRLQ